MRKIIKYALCIFGFLFIVLASGLFYLTYFFSTDSIRKHLGEVLSAKTGYNVQLHQSAHIAFFPQFKASLYSIVLAAPRSKGLAPLMRAEEMEINLSLLKALCGQLEFSSIKIVKPQFFLAQPIYDLGTAMQKIFNPNGNMRKSLRTINIEDGSLAQLRDITAQISFGGVTQRPYVEVKAKLYDKPVQIQTHIVINNEQHISLPDLMFSSAKSNLRGALQLALVHRPLLTGSVAIEQLDLQSFIGNLWSNYIAAKTQQSMLTNLDLRLSSKIANYKNVIIKNLAITLQADSKNLLLGIGNAETPYGIISGSIKSKREIENTAIEAVFSSRKLDLATIARWSKIDVPIKAYGVVNMQTKSKLNVRAVERISGNKPDNILNAILAHMVTKLSLVADSGTMDSYIIPVFGPTKPGLPPTEQIINSDKRTLYNFKNLKLQGSFSSEQTRIDSASVILDEEPMEFSALKLNISSSFIVRARSCVAAKPIEFFLLQPAMAGSINYIAGDRLPEKYKKLDKNFLSFVAATSQTEACVK